MKLFNPKLNPCDLEDEAFRTIVQKTIDFFEQKGLRQIKQDDQAMTWYEDFLSFVRREQVFATLLTPSGYGDPASRWDMSRIARYNEVLAFYGLCYWYTWQVSILGLGPIWMSDNEPIKQRTAELLKEGGIFAFGLSERTHGADIYSTEMALFPQGDGTFKARGSKYYIGNGNRAALVSTFGKIAGSDDYVFFAVRTDHPSYECKKKIHTSGVRQAFVAEYELHDYPITEADILSRGKQAWESSLSTVNIGKFELGFASIGICTHALYEAVNHASGRVLYGKRVTDFDHVQKTLTDAFCRLLTMRLVGLRAKDYMRSASDQDRRYLLYNPIVKMKVTSQGDRVITMLHNVIAAKGFEQDTYFEMATRDIGMLPRLEGTEHVNMALIIKFIQSYFFNPVDYPELPKLDQPGNDAYLFRQYTGGLSKVTFPDYRRAYQGIDLPNVALFREQVETFRKLLISTPPSKEQAENVAYMLDAGELFTMTAYAQLLLESAKIHDIDQDLLDQMFDILVRDFSGYALHMVLNHENSTEQEQAFMKMMKKPVHDKDRFGRVFREHVLSPKDRYEMSP